MAQHALSSYAQAHRHFYTAGLPPLLLATVTEHRGGVIADLGAGDGATLWALEQRALLGDTAYAVDLSPERVARAEGVSPRIRGLVADATNVDELVDGSVDGVIASQVIEHLEDDRALAPEIAPASSSPAAGGTSGRCCAALAPGGSTTSTGGGNSTPRTCASTCPRQTS